MARKKKEDIVDEQPIIIDESTESLPPKTIEGLGDVIEAITSKLNIKKCDACEQRRINLNKKFPKLKTLRKLTEEEIAFVKSIKNVIKSEDKYKLGDLYEDIYKVKVKHCNCPPLYRGILDKLFLVVEYNKEDEDE